MRKMYALCKDWKDKADELWENRKAEVNQAKLQVVRQMAKRKYIKYGIVVLITALLVFYFRDSWGETAREIMHTPLKNVLAVTGLSTCFFL